MKTPDEIKNRLEAEERNLQVAYPQYECAGDYIRGWVAALTWVLIREKEDEK